MGELLLDLNIGMMKRKWNEKAINVLPRSYTASRESTQEHGQGGMMMARPARWKDKVVGLGRSSNEQQRRTDGRTDEIEIRFCAGRCMLDVHGRSFDAEKRSRHPVMLDI